MLAHPRPMQADAWSREVERRLDSHSSAFRAEDSGLSRDEPESLGKGAPYGAPQDSGQVPSGTWFHSFMGGRPVALGVSRRLRKCLFPRPRDRVYAAQAR